MTSSQESLWRSESEPDVLAIARRVLEIEGQALEKLAVSLDGTFAEAVRILAVIAGRVVVTGMGKSGHIARKLAATMASTGTPAMFVHPAEASHGDLGMITDDDAVLALSNSGETTELSDIVEYTRRFKIPLIALVGRARSTLGDTADVALILPDSPEACPMGMAPTTSTTLALALGDALSIALLERSGFSPANFQELHPGGNLGRRLTTVTDLMHSGGDMPLIGPDRRMSEALIEMTAKTFGCVGVIDDGGRLIGIITDGDLRRHMGSDFLDRRTADIMTPSPKTIRRNALAAEALWVMSTRTITSLFVAKDGKPVGILHLHDCLRAGIA
ncbi:MAG: KpsF/GutQ family sugar-phosphate isomerase [Alphaproteobacteria bacterium]|jgi:arabinose-5-phosphate isomerase|nr:KpsF/GutQ family sugar-phosphate isomerase [Alphaproteobacteria bacterium]MDP6517230.1 KpsF/GutQ family sugar-phosphate isomerase [Alphaproteobacteria bacterium]